MPPSPTWPQRILVVTLLTIGAWLGLHASLPGTTVGILWPPAGLALGFLLRWGPGLWPTLLVSCLIQTLVVQGLTAPAMFRQRPGHAALLVALLTFSNFIVPLLAERLVRPALRSARFGLKEALAIFIRGGLLAQVFSALGGIGIFTVLGHPPVAGIPRALFVWWASNVTSVGLLAVWMAALVHGDLPAKRLSQGRPLVLFLGVALGTALSFFLPGWLALPDVHLELLVVFPVLMSAFALGVSGAATAALHCATVTLAGTLLGQGSFAHSASFTTLLSLQVYLLTVMGASLALGDTRRRWKETQEDLETSEAWFREVFHGVRDAVVVLDPSTRQVERANAAADGLLGEAPSLETLASGPLAPDRQADTLAQVDAGRVLQEVWSLPGDDADPRWVEGTLQGLHLGGEPRVLLTLRDITDRRRAEAEGEQLRAQLIQAQKMEAVGMLAAGIAHDFNNLLTALQGHSDLLLEDAPPGLHRSLERQREVIQRGTALTRTLLAFSRPGGPERRILDLNLQLAESLQLLRSVVGSLVQVSFHPAPGTALLEASASQMDQVLVNLACNARDAMPRGGRIHLETTFPGEGWVGLTVRDTGSGMDEATRQRIFDPFYTTKPAGKGTGLGLATVMDIVKTHHGTIRVESAPGEGSAFHLRFPRLG